MGYPVLRTMLLVSNLLTRACGVCTVYVKLLILAVCIGFGMFSFINKLSVNCLLVSSASEEEEVPPPKVNNSVKATFIIKPL